MTGLDPSIAARLRRNPAGLVPAVVQRYDTGEVLMLAWMDDEALRRTLATGRATYFSRSRGTLWVKGETSGHYQYVTSVALDCDADALLIQVDQVGPACHTGAASCFHDELRRASPRAVAPDEAAGSATAVGDGAAGRPAGAIGRGGPP